MKNSRITALCLAVALTLVTIGYNVGAQLEAALTSYMDATTARAVSTMMEK